MADRSGPLADLTVIEIGQYIAAPYAAKILADLGAAVTKVEAPGGDPMRRWQGESATSPQFQAYNRNKRSVTLDLKSESGLAGLHRLAAQADILIENFRPGVSDRLGFGPDALRRANPSLITCSITGFGRSGPMAQRPSFDTVVSALSGMYSQLAAGSLMRPIGPAFSDLISGMSAVQAILAAVHERDTSGTGQHIDITMVGSMLDFLTEATSTYLSTQQTSQPDSRARRAQAYACTGSDGKSFVVHLSVPEKFWTGLLTAFQCPELGEDPRFNTREGRVAHYDELAEALQRVTSAAPRAHWLERLRVHDVPSAPLNTIADLPGDEQIAEMGLMIELSGPNGDRMPMMQHSAEFSRSGRPTYLPAPALGEHNTALLPAQLTGPTA